MDWIKQIGKQVRMEKIVTLSERMEKHKKTFDEIVAKIKECDENIFRYENIKATLVGERDIAKGRYNEVKELLEEERKKTP